VFTASVIDQTTGLAIAGANVSQLDNEQGTFTDNNGKFEIVLDILPTTIKISHIGYSEKELLIDKRSDEASIIYLSPTSTILNSIEFSSASEKKSLSKRKKYSVLDYQFINNSIVRLELHGFRDYRISKTNLSGEVSSTIKLDRKKGVENFYKSCNNNLYLVYSNNALLIDTDKNNIKFSNVVRKDTFLNLIKTCKLRIDENLYYQYESYNGLSKDISAYNVRTQESKHIKSIYDPNQVKSYVNDMHLISKGQLISNIRTNSVGENERIRNLQENSDFYLTVFYKPEFPIYICESNSKLTILNHIQGKVEIFEKDLETYSDIEIEYVDNKNWLKHIVVDEISKGVYTLFKDKNKITVHLINVESGETEFKTSIKSNRVEHRSIKVHDGFLYYLVTDFNNRNKELVKLEI